MVFMAEVTRQKLQKFVFDPDFIQKSFQFIYAANCVSMTENNKYFFCDYTPYHGL